MKIHICNEAYIHLTKLTAQCREIAYSYDNDKHKSLRAAKEFYDYLEENAPQKFHLIQTGEYIPSSIKPIYLNEKHWLTWDNYDNEFRHILVPVAVWEQYALDVLTIDRWWRQEAEAVSAGLAMPIYWKNYQIYVEAWWEDNSKFHLVA
jgi:hypothetical protein